TLFFCHSVSPFSLFRTLVLKPGASWRNARSSALICSLSAEHLRDAAVAAVGQKEHLVLPGVRAVRPAGTKNNRPGRPSPVPDLSPVSGRDIGHDVFPFDALHHSQEAPSNVMGAAPTMPNRESFGSRRRSRPDVPPLTSDLTRQQRFPEHWWPHAT